MNSKLKVLALMLVISILAVTTSFGVSAANSGSAGTNATWSYNTSSATLTIEGTGAITTPQWNVEGFAVQTVVISNGITSICSNAFDNCKYLRNISIPASVTSIGENVFYLKMIYTPVSGTGTNDDAEIQVSYAYDVTIQGTNNSYAQQYATAHNIDFTLGINPNTPDAPVVQSVTGTTVTLVAVSGNEYSIDGVNFQASNVFSGLEPATQYSFYQRIAAAGGYSASEASNPTVVTTGKSTQSAVPTASVSTINGNTVVATYVEGAEYSVDGVTYQASNIFNGLNYSTNYTLYVRYAETEVYNAGTPATVAFKTGHADDVGDLDNSGIVDNMDLLVLKRYAVGYYQDKPIYIVDCNGDGKFSVLDIIRLKNYLVDNSVQLG